MKIVLNEEYNVLKECQTRLSEIKRYLRGLSIMTNDDITKLMNNIDLFHIYDLAGLEYLSNIEPEHPEDCGERIRPFDLINYSGSVIYVWINNVITPMIVLNGGKTVQEEYSTSGYSITCNTIHGFYKRLIK